MSRRARAFGFLLAAAMAAVAAATIANGYGDSVVRGYGELRPVVVATSGLPAGEQIDPEVAAADLEVRRVPVRFTPPGALATPTDAVGLVPAAPVPAGSYLLAIQLHPPRPASVPGLEGSRRPVEIAVSGAGALDALGAPVGSKVDVAVTTESDGSGDGRTYVAAPAVPLLGLGPGGEGAAGETATATLGLTRPQALRLIQAESFARRITLIPRG
ncbi:MAG TPA: SAF domain-containing protein [Solirubrobacterales bacterium]|nr:SAF domain-containing protein [Solirubrobacterales bacterium]